MLHNPPRMENPTPDTEPEPAEPAAGTHTRDRARVDGYFTRVSSYWEEVYGAGSVEGEIYRDRQERALAWIDEIAPAAGARVLELGCGAGLLSVALARRGLRVDAVDSAPAMVERTSRRVEEEGVGDGVDVGVADAHALDRADAAYDLVVALGLLPWVRDPQRVVGEVARVVRPGGHVLVTADNRARATYALDPRKNVALAPLRRRGKALLRGGAAPGPSGDGVVEPALHRAREVRAMLVRAGLAVEREQTVGFGPFTLLYRDLLDAPRARRVNRALQRLADRGTPMLRGTGSHYLVLARRPA